MKVRAVKSFAGLGPGGIQISVGMGDVFELPPGVDWLRAGLVEPFDSGEAAVELAVDLVPERAVSSRDRKKQGS